MRVQLIGGRIVKLRHFRLCHAHYILLCGLQRECPNLPLELDGEGRSFVPIHAVELDRFQLLTMLNS